MLIINPKKYRGRFYAKAVELHKEGKKIGFVWCDDDGHFECHKCNKISPHPELDKVEQDALGECPNCKYPFIFAHYSLA